MQFFAFFKRWKAFQKEANVQATGAVRTCSRFPSLPPPCVSGETWASQVASYNWGYHCNGILLVQKEKPSLFPCRPYRTFNVETSTSLTFDSADWSAGETEVLFRLDPPSRAPVPRKAWNDDTSMFQVLSALKRCKEISVVHCEVLTVKLGAPGIVSASIMIGYQEDTMENQNGCQIKQMLPLTCSSCIPCFFLYSGSL